MKKRVLALLLASAMMLTAACGNAEASQQEQTAQETQEERQNESEVETETEEASPFSELVEEGLDYFYARNGKEVDNKKAFEIFSEAAEQGDAAGFYYLGRVYQTPEYQTIVNADYAKSTEAFQKALELGYPLAGVDLGQTYEYGQGVRIDYEKAKEYYNKALAEGCVEANCGLGRLYYNRKCTDKNQSAANKLFLSATESKEPVWAARAYNELANIEQYGDSYVDGTVYDYDNEEGRTIDYEKVIEYLEKANETCTWSGSYLADIQSAYTRSGDKNNAQIYKEQFLTWCDEAVKQENVRYLCDSGDIFSSNGYVDRDEAKAFEYYLKAAELGDSRAMIRVADCYKAGVGTEQDNTAALEWLEKAADLGDSQAMNNMGYMLGFGENLNSTIEWFEKAAALGVADSMNNLGYIYLRINNDYENAKTWYEKAIELGSLQALANLGWMYINGEGVEQNESKAIDLFREAAKAGNELGTKSLGECYANGTGVNQDLETALDWLNKALVIAERAHNNAEIESVQEWITSVEEAMQQTDFYTELYGHPNPEEETSAETKPQEAQPATVPKESADLYEKEAPAEDEQVEEGAYFFGAGIDE